MNELFEKIATEVFFDESTNGAGQKMYMFGDQKMQKFAELIVQETIKQMAIQMDEFGDDQSNNPDWYKSEEAVKKHFGVEE